MNPAPLRLQINGEPRQMPEGTTVAALLDALKLDRVQVAVEVNGGVVRRARHPEHTLRDGDQIEIVTFVGGG